MYFRNGLCKSMVKISSASNRKEIRSGSLNSTTISRGFLQDFLSHLNHSHSHLDRQNSFRVIRLMAIKGFTEWSTLNEIWACENFFIFFEKNLFFVPSKIVNNCFGCNATRGHVNIRSTPTAFNPDLSHTHRKRFALWTVLLHFYIFVFRSLSLTSLREIFPKPKKRAQKHRNKSNKIIHVDLGLQEGWNGKGSYIIDSTC